MTALTLNNFLIYTTAIWVANITLNLLYVLKRYLPQTAKYDYPVDLGRTMGDGWRVLGPSTTLYGVLVTMIMVLAYTPFFRGAIAIWIPAFVFVGHMLGSFIKRRLHVPDGHYLLLVDHGDYTIFTSVVLLLIGHISWQLALTIVIFTYLTHPLACLLAFKLKLKENPY